MKKPYLAMTGFKRPGESFEIKKIKDELRPTEPPPVEPHLIHNGTGTARCSVCATPVNIPPGIGGTCPNCGAQFGGCG